MLSKEDNELLTRVGPGTPMGEFMRRFWLPALISTEVETDGAPVRLMLLGEKLLAFRDSSGRVGILDHECPHRCASLFYGRNEHGGIRCAFHGWKFDVDGQCLEMPNVPPKYSFADRVKARAYTVAERNGVIWTYMGPGEAPPLPAFPVCDNPVEQLTIEKVQSECNWLQVMEGDIDTSHAGFLHSEITELENYKDEAVYWMYARPQPEYEIMATDWGMMYGSFREAEKDKDYWRIANFCLPFWGSGRAQNGAGVIARVPMDDTHTMSIAIQKTTAIRPVSTVLHDPVQAMAYDEYLQPNTSDWYGRYRLQGNQHNDYLIDRELQKKGNFSGILGIPLQDNAIQESMGEIQDRTKEHLAYSDRMIIFVRKLLIEAVKKLRDEGELPKIAEDPQIYASLAGRAVVTPKNLKLWDVYEQFALPHMLKLQRGTAEAAE